MKKKREFIEKVIKNEEERFHETLNEGLHILAEMADEAKKAGRIQITGAEAFKLYDTYGFPFDLTEDFAMEQDMTVDREAFDVAMDEQRSRARAARQDEGSMEVQGGVLGDIKVKSEFVGYTELVSDAQVLTIVYKGELVDSIEIGKDCQVILDRTPFYAESGGQVADKGLIKAGNTQGKVTDTQKAPNGQHVLTVLIEQGILKVGDRVDAVVDRSLSRGYC